MKYFIALLFIVALGSAAQAQTATPTGLSSLALATAVHDTDTFPICQNGSASCSLVSYVWSDVNISQIASFLASRTTTLTNKTISCSNNTCTNIPTSALSGFLAAANFPALSGDVSTSAGSLTTVLNTVNSAPGATTCSNITTNGKGLVTSNTNGTCGSGATSPGGTSGQVEYNNAGAFGGFTLGGDAALNTSTGALTLNTVNGSPGSTTCSNITTNQKGLVTSNSTGSCGSGSTFLLPISWGPGQNLSNVPISFAIFSVSRTVTSVSCRVDTPVGGTATIQVWIAPSGTALGSGTQVTTTSCNANGTANTSQTGLASASVSVPAGDAIGIVSTGAGWTSSVGSGNISIGYQ